MNFVTKPSTITAVLSVAAILAGAFGHSAFAAFLNDPATGQAIATAAGAVGTLVAAGLEGWKAK